MALLDQHKIRWKRQNRPGKQAGKQRFGAPLVCLFRDASKYSYVQYYLNGFVKKVEEKINKEAFRVASLASGIDTV